MSAVTLARYMPPPVPGPVGALRFLGDGDAHAELSTGAGLREIFPPTKLSAALWGKSYAEGILR